MAGILRIFEAALGFSITEGNSVVPLRNGVEIFPAMLREIEAAEKTIDFLTFVYWRGEISDRFASALAAKAREGLRVRVLLDGFGARCMRKELISELKDAGAQVHFFRPLTWRLWRAVHRTHRKVLVCDDRVGFTGGVGIAEEWTGDARNPSEWRETHFELRGPVVLGLRSAFLSNWLECTGVADIDLRIPLEPERAGRASVQVIQSSASVDWSDAAYALRLCLAQAQERLSITTAYFVPDAESVQLLVQAAERGVDVSIMIPGKHTDTRVTRWGAERRFDELLRAGIHLHSYERTMLHAKLITVDGHLACIGSANFNYRSMSEDDEVVLVIEDEDLVKKLDQDFEKDLEGCEEVYLESWRRRKGHRRLREKLAHFLRRRI